MRYLFLLFCLITVKTSFTQYTDADRSAIYETVTGRYADTGIALINETYCRIYKYDIDGDIHRHVAEPPPKAGRTVLYADAQAIVYQQTISEYLGRQMILVDTAYLFDQLDHVRIDSLHRYTANWPGQVKRSETSGLFALEQKLLDKPLMTVLSDILFISSYNLAFVKIQEYPYLRPEIPEEHWKYRDKKRVYYASNIVVLKKTGTGWIIQDVLKQKTP